MKRFIYIIFILIANHSFAQYQAEYHILRAGTGFVDGVQDVLLTVEAYSGATLVDSKDICSVRNAGCYKILNSPTPITRLEILARIVSGPRIYSQPTVVNVTDPACFYTKIPENFQPTDGRLEYEVKAYKLSNTVQPINNTICIDAPFVLTAGELCPEVMTGPLTYNWQYKTNASGPFIDFNVQTIGSESVSINLNNYLSGNEQNLFIRAEANTATTQIWTYSIISCTPGITSVATTATTCSNSSDGSFTITFEEALNNQQILFELRRDSATGPIENSFTATISGTTYTWPNPLVARTYFLEYQASPAGSVVQYSPIIITSPAAVTFAAGWTDVDCFGENTGRISISASGGTGSYQYSINNGSTWSNFNNATSHNATNLPAGNYQVKVRDANDCIAQE